ncbi:hypothetical protein J1N35_005239, partial [Gossypium stocksii]
SNLNRNPSFSSLFAEITYCHRKKIAEAPTLLPHITVVITAPTVSVVFTIASPYPPCRFLFSPLCRNFAKFLGKDTESRKRIRSLKTTPENLIMIDKVKERFDSIFKHQPMIPEK